MINAAKRGGWRLPRSIVARTLVVLALIAFVQVGFVVGLVVSQRDGAHILDISGAQRMRSQRIAYLAELAREGAPVRAWRDELDATVSTMLDTRAELLRRRDVSPFAVDARGNTPAGTAVLRYAQAARTIVRYPHDSRAQAYIMAERLPLLAIAEGSVLARTKIVVERTRQILVGIVAGLLALLVTMWLAFKGIVEPSERRTSELVRRLTDAEAQMRSLFANNPDSIAMYDRDGRIVRGNRASSDLLGSGANQLLGQHFTHHVVPAHANAVETGFRRALGGESVTMNTTFYSDQDARIDVQATLFPNVVGGEIVGVIGVAKDTRALRRAEEAYRAQSERITELYRTFAFQNRSWERQVRETLVVAAQRLGYEWAGALEMVDGIHAVVAVVGDAGFEDGDIAALAPELTLLAKSASDVWTIDDVARSPLHADSPIHTMAWGSLLGTQVVIGDVTYGSLLLGARQAHRTPLDAVDRDFMRLVAALIGASVQRGRQEQKLDTLAFFDSLTSLPNRVTLERRMAQSLAAASRHKLQFAVHYLDLDRFKSINDRFGHAIGDEVLRQTARRLEECTRKEDTIARIGGDEFVILQALDPDGRGARELATRVITSLGLPFDIDGSAHRIGVSIGISTYPHDGSDQTTLVRHADEALLRAKSAGRNRIEFAEPVYARATSH